MAWFYQKQIELPSPEQALQGREMRVPVPEMHFVNGNPLEPPFPDGLEMALFGMGCFWGAERVFWQAPGVYTTAVGYAAGYTPNPTYEEVCSGRTAHNEVVLVAFDPSQTSYDEMLKLFWENHDPTQGMRQGADTGTQYRSGIYCYSPEQLRGGRAHARHVPARAERPPLRPDHDRDHRRARVLLRRGLPPAVPREGAERLLRPRRHGAELSRRRGRDGVAFPGRTPPVHCMQ